MNEIIKVNNAAMSFKNYNMKPQSYSIPQGFLIGVVGRNGAGKSTFLKMLQGAYKNMTGEISIKGMDVVSKFIDIRKNIGFVSDDKKYFMSENSFENEKHFSVFYPEWDSDLYRKMLEDFKINTTTPLEKMSRGQFIKFQTAFALAQHPRILLLDEPMANMDPVFRDDYIKLLQTIIAEYETTILMATHLKDDLEKIADYIIDIERGEIYESGV